MANMKKIQLYFDEPSHTYTDDEGNVYTSATTLIDKVSHPFNARYWAMYRALEESGYKVRPEFVKGVEGDNVYIEDRSTPIVEWVTYSLDSLYSGVLRTKRTVEAIKDDWKQLADTANDWGTDKHNYLEDCVNSFYNTESTDRESGTIAELTDYDKKTSSFRYKIVDEKSLSSSPLTKSHPSIYKLLVDLIRKGFILYAEKRVYSYEHRVSGTIDILAVNNKNEFYIVDWKTNKDEIQFESGYFKKVWNADRSAKIKTTNFTKSDKRFKHPISSISYSTGNKYSLQLSIYAYLCELWGLKCLGLVLCHIRHIEKVKRNTFNKVGLDLNIKKKEISPRIYRSIAYFKSQTKTLVEWNRDRCILSQKEIDIKYAALPPYMGLPQDEIWTAKTF